LQCTVSLVDIYYNILKVKFKMTFSGLIIGQRTARSCLRRLKFCKLLAHELSLWFVFLSRKNGVVWTNLKENYILKSCFPKFRVKQVQVCKWAKEVSYVGPLHCQNITLLYGWHYVFVLALFWLSFDVFFRV